MNRPSLGARTHHLLIALVGFALAAASSLGVTLFAASRLERVVRVEQRTIAARKADSAWFRVMRESIALDLVCIACTGGLAMLALRSGRLYMAAEERRVEELDAFASRVAHDIRGPMSPSLLALQRLARDLDAQSPNKPVVDKGLRSLKRADVLVQDLLTFARAAAKPDPNAHASLPAVIGGVVQDLERAASEAHVQVATNDLTAREVSCAPGVLLSIVGNLVSNAIKYMPPDSEARRVSIRAYDEGPRVRVEVSDTGDGLPEAARERIFEPFVQMDSSRPGIGLGLATVKRLVEAHRGRVGVHSRAGSGSVFWFEVPTSRHDQHRSPASRIGGVRHDRQLRTA